MGENDVQVEETKSLATDEEAQPTTTDEEGAAEQAETPAPEGEEAAAAE